MEQKELYHSPQITIEPFAPEDIITLSNEPTTGGIELPDDIWITV